MGAPAAFVFIVLAVALAPLAAVSGPFEEGVDAYSSGDVAAAVGLWRPLAERGDSASQHNLGVVYRDGQGVARDHAEAAKWFRLAADRGHALAQNNLSVMYALGEGVPRDLLKVHMWFSLAASRFPPGEDRHKALRARDMTAAQMTPGQISEARKLAREWKPRGERAE